MLIITADIDAASRVIEAKTRPLNDDGCNVNANLLSDKRINLLEVN